MRVKPSKMTEKISKDKKIISQFIRQNNIEVDQIVLNTEKSQFTMKLKERLVDVRKF